MERDFKRGRERGRERSLEREPERELEREHDQVWQPLRLARRGDGRAEGQSLAIDLDRLYRQMHGSLMRYAMRHVDADEAKDVVHDAMLKYVEQADRERVPLTERDARARLVVILHDVLLDQKRTARRRKRLLQFISGSTAAMRRRSNPRRATEDGEIMGAIHQVLESLPDCVRMSWTTVREHGIPLEEAAELFGVETVSVRGYLLKANKALRQRLTRDGITPATLRGRDDR
ncbi:MAG: RNA polymerase sigma factor [Gemmatimonadaceae bacterium]